MRLVVTGLNGQVVTALRNVSGPGITVLPVGRPELDLAKPETILPALEELAPNVIVHAAAYTAVDKAESEPELATLVNAKAVGPVAYAARKLGVPLIYLSTDYVFDGRKESPYTEDDAPRPINVYGTSKLGGERVVSVLTEDYVILRTSWLYAPYGKNFVRTMYSLREREELRVVADALGCPTYAPDLACGILLIAQNLIEFPSDRSMRGIFNFAGRGETSWAGLAQAVFRSLAAEGLSVPRVIPVAFAEYPTPAKRPLNSRLNLAKLERVFRFSVPHWGQSLAECMHELREGELVNY